MYTAITILIIIASVLLTAVVLLQNSKGGGLAANFAAGNQTFGVRQTADFLEKATWVLAIAILALCILAAAFVPGKGGRQAGYSTQYEESMPTQQTPSFPTLPEAASEEAPEAQPAE